MSGVWVRCGSKNKHYKDMYLKEIEPWAHLLILAIIALVNNF